jgi:hypothetical protein
MKNRVHGLLLIRLYNTKKQKYSKPSQSIKFNRSRDKQPVNETEA